MDDETRDALAAMGAKIDEIARALNQTRLDLHEVKRSLLDLCMADYDAIVIAIANINQDRQLATETIEQLRSHHASVKKAAGAKVAKEAGETDGG